MQNLNKNPNYTSSCEIVIDPKDSENLKEENLIKKQLTQDLEKITKETKDSDLKAQSQNFSQFKMLYFQGQQIAKIEPNCENKKDQNLLHSVFKNIKEISDTSSSQSNQDSNSSNSSDYSSKVDSLYKKSPCSNKKSVRKSLFKKQNDESSSSSSSETILGKEFTQAIKSLKRAQESVLETKSYSQHSSLVFNKSLNLEEKQLNYDSPITKSEYDEKKTESQEENKYNINNQLHDLEENKIKIDPLLRKLLEQQITSKKALEKQSKSAKQAVDSTDTKASANSFSPIHVPRLVISKQDINLQKKQKSQIYFNMVNHIN